ncbi:Membrane protein involved in the export of O-antigen and teichoic acid [Marinobacter gudaonensis]|uniref:Membrane protein involved in the export of O-antigen and teichoic acid n=1 Tax=Marinobacter gudaonensis TaxID=375760 RepID=A0A1I6GJE1_9GAMM|nr:hypothetical protein [Marinobacter gudaonensis]SFR42298.1 Membrane protein involved in the export of O-antigen and teichoic acid [Marinobacter gudaonensis]
MRINAQAINVFIRGLTLGVRFSLILFLSIYLTPSELGLFGLISVSVIYSLYFVGLDFYTFSLRFLVGKPIELWPRYLFSEGILFLSLYLIFLPALLLVFHFGLLPWWTSGFVALLIVLEHISQEVSRLAIAAGRPVFSSILTFTRQASWVLFIIPLMSIFPGFRTLEAVLSFWVFGSSLSVCLCAFYLWSMNWRGSLSNFNFGWIKKGVVVAIPLLLASLALRGVTTFDRYFFEAFNSKDLLGAYSLYIGMAGAMLTFLDAGVFAFLYPKLIAQSKDSSWSGFRKTLNLLRQQTVMFSVLMFFGASALGPLIFYFLPYPIYFENWPLFIFVLIGVLFSIFGMMPHYALYALSEDRVIVCSNVFGFLVFVILALTLKDVTPYWSVVLAVILSALGIWLSKEVGLRLVLRKVSTC